MQADGKQVQPEDELKHAIFLGSRDVKIDPKNRIMLPVNFRRVIKPERDGKGFIAMVGPADGKIWIFTERRYYTSAAEQRSRMLRTLTEQEFKHMWFGMAEYLEFDGQERLLLPDKHLKRAKLGKDATVVGVEDCMQIWNQSEWAAHEDELDKKRVEITANEIKRQATQVAIPKHVNFTYSE